jgi:hypothetical protein
VNLVPEGQVNRTLTTLTIGDVIDHPGQDDDYDGEKIIALASRCINLEHWDFIEDMLSPDQQRRWNLLLVGSQTPLCRGSNPGWFILSRLVSSHGGSSRS